VIATGACSSGSATPAPSDGPRAPPKLAPLADDTTYAKLCMPCHGREGLGYVADHAPSLVSMTFLESASDSFLHRAIANGRPGTSMAAYGKHLGGPLDDAAIDHLIALLRGHGPSAKPLPAVAQGDAARGEPTYTQLCKPCHGDAVTRGEAPHLANLQFLANATTPFIHYAVVHGRPGTKMEPFAQKLTPEQIDDVVAYVRTLANPAPMTTQDQLPAPSGTEPVVLNPTGKPPRFTTTGDGGKYVSAAQVAAAVAAKQKLVIIDARPPSDWRQVHITGAVSIPHYELKRLDDVPKDGTWIVSYCACPHHLSGIVTDELRKRGYTHAVVLDEGILEWQRRGYPIVAAPGHVMPPKERPVPAGTIQ
jgi:cytochrome c oxidase cbb3-type subunit 3/ubiquinol-cytochrome c reductase cytochrome c subunit